MRRISFVLLSLSFIACQAPYSERGHLIQTHASGIPLNPRSGEYLDVQSRPPSIPPDPEKYYDDYLDAMFKAADGYNDRNLQQAKTESGRPIRRILIHVHGGLNSHNSAAKTAKNTADLIMDGQYDGKDYPDSKAYPIYLTWNSAPISTYTENVYPTRRGYYTPVAAGISIPGQIASDLGRGVGRFPMTIWRQISTEWQSTLSIRDKWLMGYYPSWKHAENQYQQYAKTAKQRRLLDLQKGTYFARSWPHRSLRAFLYFTCF